MIRVGRITIDRQNCVVTHKRKTLRFYKDPRGNHHFAIMQHLIMGGQLSALKLFDLLYGDREDGGPDTHVIRQKLCRLRKIVKRIGLKIARERRGTEMLYWIEPVK